jgi:hypothetical protein
LLQAPVRRRRSTPPPLALNSVKVFDGQPWRQNLADWLWNAAKLWQAPGIWFFSNVQSKARKKKRQIEESILHKVAAVNPRL